MRELFNEKSEEIMELLWNLTSNIFGVGVGISSNISTNNDLLEEIYKEKNENQLLNRKFPSQIVNPNAGVEKIQPRQLFNSAIERVRDDKKKERDRGDKYNNKNERNYDRKGFRDYYERRGDDRRRNRRDDNVMQVGDKKVVLKRRSDKSKSPSPVEKRERSRDERIQPEEEQYDDRERFDRDREIPYGPRHYYPNDNRFYVERGFYPMRRFSIGRGRYAPRGSFIKPRYMEPRR
jgi:hypothetical protein